MNNPMEMLKAFNEFRRTYTGNAEEEVKRMLQSGQITQNQLNEAQKMAKELLSMLQQ